MKHTTLAALTCLLLASSAASAQTYPATKPPGGLDSTTVIPKVYADGSSGTLGQIGQMADGSVQQTSVGAASGVAPLDASKMMSAAVSGDSSASPVLATSTTTPRTQADRAADQRNIKDYGASLTGSSADEAPITTAFSGNAAGQKIFVSGGVWPSQGWWPSDTGKTKF
ncbi:MAG: hypothetical protein ABF430_12325, partial [Acetobacter persici]